MIDELRQFLLVVETGTFTEAARRAHLSQPALSAAIRRLEDQLGARLLHRGRTGAEPTAAGEALVPRARAALGALDEARRAVEEVAGLRAGEVRIGAGATVCTHLLPPFLAQFRRAHPRIRFRLRELNPDAIADALHDRDLDLGIAAAGRGERWLADPLVLVGPPGVERAGAPFVTFPPGATTRALLDRHFPEREIVMELASISAILGNVRAGIGIALVSRAAAESDLASGRLRTIPDRRTPIARTLRLLHNGVPRLSPAARALRELLLAGAPGRPQTRGR